ncbi:MAG: hypothetical protein JNM36_08290 [Chitinophagales bacterium]|nr:hypothetical protein [Chitinophagales bacterium]
MKRIMSLYFYPENEYFGFYVFVFNSLNRINELISDIETVLSTGVSKQIPGEEVSFFDVTTNEIALTVLLPGYTEPLYINTVTFLNVLVEYREWLLLLYSCQIPGIIPPSKLDTWSCVPNEYVKPEYWELLKQQTEGRE